MVATFSYFSEFGDFTNEMSRGGLAKPTDTLCQFVFFAYIIFHEIMNDVCRNSLCNALMVISDVYSFNIEKKHGYILSNILLNNYPHMFTYVYMLYMLYVICLHPGLQQRPTYNY